MNIQINFTSPLYDKSEQYYENYLQKTIDEIIIFISNKNIKYLTIAIYDLIDEYDRTTKKIIIQKKRIDNNTFIDNLKNRLKNKINLLNDKLIIKYRLFRAIRENENEKQLLDWFINIGNNVADSFVFAGNYKNKLLTTDKALKFITNNNIIKKEYGCVTIFHRNNELERCLHRINLGSSFFVSQIIVDNNVNDTTKDFFNIINVPIYINITLVSSSNIWNLLKSLGVISNYNFENNIPQNENEIYNHIYKLIKFIKKENKYISFEMLTHIKKERTYGFLKFNELLNK
jgi:hypothetical protein